MPTYVFPSSATLKTIEQTKIAQMTNDGDPIWSIFPMTTEDTDTIMWEQMDNYVGLQALRGLNGQPRRVATVGANRYIMRPGVYGEHMPILEDEMTRRRRFGTFNEPVDISDLVMGRQDQLLTRRLNRIRKIGWDLITLGYFTNTTDDGTVAHTDAYVQRTFTSTVLWSTAATSTPLADFRAVKLLQRGYSMSLGSQATAYMNQTTFNYLTVNTNAADLGGKRTSGLATIIGLADTNKVLLQEDLPQIQIYEGGYLDDNGVWQLHLPTGTVIVVGRRTTGASLGRYIMTRNVNNPGFAPGAYTKVITKDDEVPLAVEVHDGHNGGPALEFPSAIIKMNVA